MLRRTMPSKLGFSVFVRRSDGLTVSYCVLYCTAQCGTDRQNQMRMKIVRVASARVVSRRAF